MRISYYTCCRYLFSSPQDATDKIGVMCVFPNYVVADLCALGYNDGMATQFSTPQNVNLNSSLHFDGSSFPLQSQLPSTSHVDQIQRNENMLALGPPQSSTSGFQNVDTSNLASYRGLDFFPEEEIRTRSHEILENEDMQHLLRMFNMGGHGQVHGQGQVHPSINASEDYPYSSAYMPSPSMNYNFDDDRSRSSGKAVVGWLKLKAALRWGIFIRKKAAERRAQLVELDES